jgi:hypothetical protein
VIKAEEKRCIEVISDQKMIQKLSLLKVKRRKLSKKIRTGSDK